MENDLGPPAVDAMMTSEKRIEIGTTVALLPFTGSNHLCLENHMQGRTQLPVCTFFNYHFHNFLFQGEFSVLDRLFIFCTEIMTRKVDITVFIFMSERSEKIHYSIFDPIKLDLLEVLKLA